VHERGAPHMANPERLVSSAARLYGGEEGLRETWGEVVPVPEDNLRVLSGGETVLGFEVTYTPGHASHHVSYFRDGVAFVGDMAGVRIPPYDLTLAPTPPPDIDVEAWERSLDAIAAWEPRTLALTHFGTADDPPAQLVAVREALHWQADLAAEHDMDGFMAALHERVADRASEEVAAVEQAAPLDHLFLGLDRWHSKRG
jgi:glyoxylase-like metal-dependent hydrolase (beta-lactamase superfamily II)